MSKSFEQWALIWLFLITAASCQTCDNTDGLKSRLDKIEQKIK